jgi:hypothetical protein
MNPTIDLITKPATTVHQSSRIAGQDMNKAAQEFSAHAPKPNIEFQ